MTNSSNFNSSGLQDIFLRLKLVNKKQEVLFIADSKLEITRIPRRLI